ncbi:sensor histidine kinase [Haloferula sp. A504]|uniref:sensor histidine kinase n=1 Tax=Haloferula sp. A504 TaxID=3373601 RepID=UPI0031C8D57E|nr:ATP-binding protein [Verrucomicrobiaceae bacterium E54]
MTEPSVILAVLAALAAIIALTLVAFRLRRARREFIQEVDAWKLRLDLDLQRARKERDLLLDALDEAFLLINRDARILFANRAAKEMFAGRSIIDRTIEDVLLERRLAAPVLECLETGENTIRRVVLRRSGDDERPGDSAWVVDAARISETPDDAPEFRVVFRDVSPEHQAEQIRKDFVANASHELRTPLAIINGYLENLLDDGLVSDPELTKRFLKVMRKHTERISRIVEDMLVISRLESGEAAALKLKPFKIRSCISDVLERLEAMIQAQKARVEIRMDDEDLVINGDRFYWTQVLFNLVENALKQNPRDGLRVTIGCHRRPDESIEIWVSDDGIGIPSTDLAHIFRRFYRVEKHHNQDQIKGTGLGLSIVKRAVEAHHGQIDVASTPGEDTRFTITLPPDAEVPPHPDAQNHDDSGAAASA